MTQMGITMGALQAELDARLAAWRKVAPAEAQSLLDGAVDQLRASGAEARALPAGAQVPDLVLTDLDGRPVRLRDLAPCVLVFYRGGWCPYCTMQLRAWQQHLPELAALGAQVVGIGCEEPARARRTAEQSDLTFPLLVDTAGATAAFGLGYDVPEELKPLLSRIGVDLPEVNNCGTWRLPMAATYVLGRDGRVLLAEANADYRRRLEPAEAIAALRAHLA
jgi:peroxiredoxin